LFCGASLYDIIMSLYIESTSLPKTERYPCPKKTIRAIFSDIENMTVLFRKRQANYPHLYAGYKKKPPMLKGPILAVIYINRDREPKMLICAVKKDEYSEPGAIEFEEIILPQVHAWIKEQLSKSELEFQQAEELIVEWTGEAHKLHNLQLRERPWP